MACLGTGRLCARVEKLCSLGKNGPIKRKNLSFISNIGNNNQTARISYHTFQDSNSHKEESTNRSFSTNLKSQSPAAFIPSSSSSSPLSVQTAEPVKNNICCSSGFKLSIQSEYIRYFGTLRTQYPGSLPDTSVDPYRLLEDDLKDIYLDIRAELIKNTNQEELQTIATYYFDGQGKALRPMVASLVARAINHHIYGDDRGLTPSQRDVAMIAEMIHSASLIHDDVIDQSNFRRGKPSVNVLWNHKKVTMAGDFILAVASMMIAKLRDDEVTLTLSQIGAQRPVRVFLRYMQSSMGRLRSDLGQAIHDRSMNGRPDYLGIKFSADRWNFAVVTDLVQGEFMQLGSKETENERFAHYLTKTYRKTASLIANSAKSVAMLAGADESLSEVAFQYGRNIGLAFQLVDDLLDFVSSADAMGKPTAADLKLGLATAPVLFACEKYPELNAMIMRRFQEPGDVEKAFELVHKSQGLEQTRFLAKKHCLEAVRLANSIAESPYQKGLVVVSDLVLNRLK